MGNVVHVLRRGHARGLPGDGSCGWTRGEGPGRRAQSLDRVVRRITVVDRVVGRLTVVEWM